LPKVAPEIEPATLIYPEIKQCDIPLSITFRWEASKVINATYDFSIISRNQISENQNPIPLLVAQNLTVNSYQYNLQGGEQYWWQVTTKNAEGKSIQSQVSYFTTVNRPPTIPIAIYPANNDTIYLASGVNEVVLRWNPAVDPDGNTVKYKAKVGYDTNTVMEFHAFENTSYNFQIDSGSRITFYWKIEAFDIHSGKSESEISRFVVIRR
jgi:hypothetical protein